MTLDPKGLEAALAEVQGITIWPATGALAAAITAYLANSSPKPKPKVKVKALVWGSTSYGTPEAITVAGTYRILEAENGGYCVTVGGLHAIRLKDADGRTNFVTMATAYSAAQADYEARILSALEITP